MCLRTGRGPKDVGIRNRRGTGARAHCRGDQALPSNPGLVCAGATRQRVALASAVTAGNKLLLLLLPCRIVGGLYLENATPQGRTGLPFLIVAGALFYWLVFAFSARLRPSSTFIGNLELCLPLQLPMVINTSSSSSSSRQGCQ